MESSYPCFVDRGLPRLRKKAVDSGTAALGGESRIDSMTVTYGLYRLRKDSLSG
jgi:hypothetical protein